LGSQRRVLSEQLLDLLGVPFVYGGLELRYGIQRWYSFG
jgi:hypothetical protein